VEQLTPEQRNFYAHTLIEVRLRESGLSLEEAHRQALERQGIPRDEYAAVRLCERERVRREWFRFTSRQRLFAGVREGLRPPPFETPPAAAEPVFCLRCGRPLRAEVSGGYPIWRCEAGGMEYSVALSAALNRALRQQRRLPPALLRTPGPLGWYCPNCGLALVPPLLGTDPLGCERCGFELPHLLREEVVELSWHDP
jgi:hypothetical protein